jgi:hypothetical protein
VSFFYNGPDLPPAELEMGPVSHLPQNDLVYLRSSYKDSDDYGMQLAESIDPLNELFLKFIAIDRNSIQFFPSP